MDPEILRAQFPALQREVNGKTAVFVDGPGGTQSPQSVIDAMRAYLEFGSSSPGAAFLTSQYGVEIIAQARRAMADFLNAEPKEIVFGQNMSSLTFSMSRALARTWQAGDEIIVTRLDHEANVSPWLMAAEDRGVIVRWLDFNPVDGMMALEQLPDLLNKKTKLLAISYACNALGSITDVQRATEMAHAYDALVFVDAVHFAPHGLVDVKALDCDFLACSTYKFYGPHTGVLFGKYALLERLTAYKVRPATNSSPGKWETGNQSYESLAAVTATIDYIAALGGQDGDRRLRLQRGMAAIVAHEAALAERFLAGITAVSNIKLYGLTDVERLDERTPTFAISIAGHHPDEIAQLLAEQGIFVYSGHYYAIETMKRLNLLDSGGLVRIGFVHYNTFAEVDRVIATLQEIA